MQFKSIRQKITFWFGLCLFLSISSLIVFSVINGANNEIQSLANLLFGQVVIGTVVFAVSMIIIWIVAGHITSPIKDAAFMAEQLSEGFLIDEIPVNSDDETGHLLKAMNNMTAYFKEMAIVSDQIANGELSVSVKPRSDNDRFGNSFQEMAAYLQDMARKADRIALGDLSVKVEPKSQRDRFGKSFRNMLDNTLSLVQSKDERDNIQKSIVQLLNEVSNVATGNLTVQAEIRSDITGSIAASFNTMIIKLRQIINQVQETTLQVNSSATEIKKTTDNLATGSEIQYAQINDTSSAIEQMATSIQEVSNNATMSAQVADRSLVSARQGAEAVQNNINAMQRIREQVQETAERVRRLGERTQEIGRSVKQIKDIAKRTSVLALNASIQASAAGESGRGFAVVAEEVERLADRAANATKQITTLTQSIQSETFEVVAAMEETTREVAEGSHLANEAGQALEEIQTVSKQLSDLIQSISQSSQQQARGSEAIANAMIGISEITEQMAKGSQKAAMSVHDLVSLADTLRGSVVTFKLPEANDNLRKFNGLRV